MNANTKPSVFARFTAALAALVGYAPSMREVLESRLLRDSRAPRT